MFWNVLSKAHVTSVIGVVKKLFLKKEQVQAERSRQRIYIADWDLGLVGVCITAPFLPNILLENNKGIEQH